MIISTFQAKKLINPKDSMDISLDLGLTMSKVLIKDKKFYFPNNQILEEKDIKKIIKKDTKCFFIENNSIVAISIFSEETQKYYKLMPTKSWPTLEISGIRMHVTKSMSPKEDTIKKISYIEPVIGNVLDTCTGLGYTAIMASNNADLVYTFEIDENNIEIQKINPHSKKLFDNPKIKRHHGDIFLEIKKLKSDFFDRIIHDPPRLTLATLLYSQGFYNELFRVLKDNGKLYHYTGDPGSKARGMDIRLGIAKRLKKSGFTNIERVYNGLVGEK